MHRGKILCEIKKHRIIDCETYGFKHAQRYPTERETREFYKEKYFREKSKKPHEMNPEKAVREKNYWDLVWSDDLYYFNEYSQSSDKKLLDIGCGNGFFLEFMEKNGWDETRIEPSLEAYEYALSLGLKVFNATAKEFLEKNKVKSLYDVVTLRNVLEHVPNPKEILNICRELLKKGGITYVSVPNDFNPLQLKAQKVLDTEPWWIAFPDHLNYFDFQTIEKLLKDTGFEILMRTTDFPMELFLLMGDNYVGNDEIGSRCHEKRMKFEMALPDDLRKKIYQNLASMGLGRTCIVYAKVR